jgi:hypothetical protein
MMNDLASFPFMDQVDLPFEETTSPTKKTEARKTKKHRSKKKKKKSKCHKSASVSSSETVLTEEKNMISDDVVLPQPPTPSEPTPEERTMFAKIEQILASAKAFEPMATTLAQKLERLVARSALQLWKVQVLLENDKEKAAETLATASAAKAQHLTKLGNQLAYTSGVQSEHLLRLLFQLDSVLGSDEIRVRRKKAVLYLKGLMGRFDAIRARALNLEPIYIKRIMRKVSPLIPAPASSVEMEDEEKDIEDSDMHAVESEQSKAMAEEEETEDDPDIEEEEEEEEDEEEEEEKKGEEEEAEAAVVGEAADAVTDELWDLVASLRQKSPELEFEFDLAQRSLLDGVLLRGQGYGLNAENVRVKVCPKQKTLHLYGLRHVQRHRNITRQRQEPRYDMFGNFRGYVPQRYIERQPVKVTQWFSQTLQLPNSIDLNKVEHVVSRDGSLQVLLPYKDDTVMERTRAEAQARARAQAEAERREREKSYYAPGRNFSYRQPSFGNGFHSHTRDFEFPTGSFGWF